MDTSLNTKVRQCSMSCCHQSFLCRVGDRGLGMRLHLSVPQVRSSYQNGYYQGSLSASRSSLLFNRLSIGVGIAIWVILALAQLSWIIPIAALGNYD